MNRLTAWSNDPVLDTPSEVIYLQDKGKNINWSVTSSPMPDEDEYYIKYGLGYAKYIHSSDDIYQEIDTFVPKDDNAKVNIIHLKTYYHKKEN